MEAESLAAAYERISDDREGLERGVSRQREDNEALAVRHGLTIVEHFVDNDRGASTRSKKSRPEYKRMLSLVEEGKVGVILAYSNSRLTRRPMEFEELIQLHERTGVLIKTVVSGEDDLSTADGRMIARIKASIDAGEAERTAERTARQHKANRDAGVPVGGARPFGWKPDKRTLDPRESKIVRELIDDIIAGGSIRGATRRLNEEGFATTLGNVWKYQTFTQYLRNARLVGYRTHKKKVAYDVHGQPIVGQWEPMVDHDTWDRLQLVLTRPEVRGKTLRPEARRYMLTGLIRCGHRQCNALMYGNARNSERHRYVCDGTDSAEPHTVSVAGDNVDRMVGRLILAKMEQEQDVAPEVKPWQGEARLAEVEGLIAQLLDQLGGSISAERIFGQVARFEEELAALKAERGEWLASSTGVPVKRLSPAEWEDLEVHHKRGYAEQYLLAVYVKPTPTRLRQWDPERIVPAWRDGSPPPA